MRFPVVVFLGFYWVLLVWWWIACLGLACSIALLALMVLLPVLYPFAWGLSFLILAFENGMLLEPANWCGCSLSVNWEERGWAGTSAPQKRRRT